VALHGDTEASASACTPTWPRLPAQAQWDGDRDTLPQAPDPQDWRRWPPSATAAAARHCPRYQGCSYDSARSRLAQAQVIVANHDLVLASLGMKALPELDNCLAIFDEGHHLPAVALDQFSSSMDLSRLRWLDVLPKAMHEVATQLHLHLGSEVPTVCSQLKAALADLARMALDLVLAGGGTDPRKGYRGANAPTPCACHGVVPAELVEPLAHILAQAGGLSTTLEALGAEVKAIAKDDPSRATQCATLYAELGTLAPRLASVTSTTSLLLEHGAQPLAKWLQAHTDGGYIHLSADACPTVPGDLLRQLLWSRVRGAGGDFGVAHQLRQLRLLSARSRSGTAAAGDDTGGTQPLRLRRPGHAHRGAFARRPQSRREAYTADMVAALLQDLRTVQRGALVLFTSRAQMRAATDALPDDLRSRVLVQGSQSRSRLLAAHAQQVAAGAPSVVFGMQSFGEGLDLPGALCRRYSSPSCPLPRPAIR